MSELAVGKKAPNFKAKTTKDETVSLNDLMGKKGLVLYFYPKDMTPGCTQEACDFRDNFARLAKTGFSVAGVSKDPVKAHQKFTEKEKLNFPLLSDEDLKICNAYGVWQEKVFMGRKGMGIVRSSFLMDAGGKILKIYSPVKVKGHVDEILKDIAELSK